MFGMKFQRATSPLPLFFVRRGVPAIALSLLALMFAGCDNPIDTAYHEQIVVAGFLIEGQPIDSIVLHRLTPFGSYYDDLDYAVDSATVTVTVDGVPHTLQRGAIKGRYYLPASELVLQGGKEYDLTITAPDWQTGGMQTLSANTIVPMPIHYSALADSVRGKTLILDTNNLSTFAFVVTADPVAPEPNNRYLMTATARDTTFGRIREKRAGPDSLQVTKYSNIQTGPAIALTARLFNWYGPNTISFYSIDTNWTDYQRQLQNTGNTTYQSTLNHVQGGMGVFASGARDTVTVWIMPKQ